MALPVFSLGSFNFITLHSAAGRDGAPALPEEQMELAQRAGVVGTGFVRLARKGMPFQMRSFVDLADESSAQTLIRNYHLAVGDDPVNIVWRDVDYFSTHSVKYVILMVSGIRSKWMASGTGGLNPPSLVSVEAIWDLMPVEIF